MRSMKRMKKVLTMLMAAALVVSNIQFATLTVNATEPSGEPPMATEQPTATPEATVEPTEVPTTEPTVEPTEVPTIEPTATPEATVEPTATPEATVEPTTTPEATVEPTATPEALDKPVVLKMTRNTADRNITTNLLSGYNSNFETAIYWNDNAHGQTYLEQVAYDEGAKPDDACSDYYVKVNPVSDNTVSIYSMVTGLESGKTYEYTFWAKLAEEESEGSLSFCAQGVENGWTSTSWGTVTPDANVTLSADAWQILSGTFVIADVLDSVQIQIKGQDGVAFCIDDLRVGLVAGQDDGNDNDNENTSNDRVITTNVLSNYNTSFEGVNDSGVLYWWNDEANGQTYIPRQAYGEETKPSNDCGDYYVLVNTVSEGGNAGAYIGVSELESGKTYEYSYYAKLAAGETSGNVSLMVQGAASDWSSTCPGTVTPDTNITLSADEWQKVTGTFVIDDVKDQVQVKFQASGVAFCIDDFKVGLVAGQDDGETDGDKNITNNVLREFNTSFEGVNDQGNLYWWNDANWSQVNIPRQEYGDAAKPADDCGSYYVQVNKSAEGVSQLKINGTGVAGALGNGTYEFSYYAKLNEGESGSVTFMVQEGNVPVAITFDETVTLNADEWQKVTGTFELTAGASEILVGFDGAGTSYCIDDLRVGQLTSTEEEGSSVVKVFTADQLNARVDWSNATFNKADGKIDIGFSGNYDELKIILPESIDMSVCEEITFTVANQTTPISFKVWGTDGTELFVKYGFTGATEYTVTPNVTATTNLLGIMCGEGVAEGAGVSLISVSLKLKGGSTVTYGDNVILNPYFEDGSEAGLAAWNMSQGTSTISVATADEAIFDDVKTYGIISRDPATSSTQDCFAQEITDAVEAGVEYQYEFYAMLSDEYIGAPAEQREVVFGPYVYRSDREEYGGNSYLGSYSSGILAGDVTQTLEPGVWTKFKGTFKIPAGEEKVFIRIIEQGTNYGSGDCVLGDYYVTGVSMREVIKPKVEIEKDIPDWKSVIASENGLGVDAIAGTCLGYGGLNDEALTDLARKHFNAITFENEMKPEAIIKLKDGEIKYDFKNADEMLAAIKAWNDSDDNPSNDMKIRGHVLVWHSQTPEWFFHEGYDASNPLVSKDTMNQRMEAYIKAVFEHFAPYLDMFYGWDVVNEAVSDNFGTYRSAAEGSTWAAVYGDGNPEFIINAFKYANKYAPAHIELYYNDYNECVGSKSNGIVELLKAVKNAEGTRIDGMGMQAHHGFDSPTAGQIEEAARKYAAVVGKVQLTELDVKASNTYDGTEATLASEHSKQAYRFKEIYDVLRKLDAEDGIDVSGITVWGIVDKYSWLQTSNNVGGAADGNPQCPLLFDDNYMAKPAYWAFVNADMLEPEIKNVTVIAKQDSSYSQGKTYSFSSGNTSASFVPMWDEDGLKVQVTVSDSSVDAADCVTVYVDEANSKSEGANIVKVSVNRADATAISGGYRAVVEVPLSNMAVIKKIGLDVTVTDGTEVAVFNDMTKKQDTSSKFYAEAVMKPYTAIQNGTVTIDGELDAAWSKVTAIPLTINLGSSVSATVRVLWDASNLYVYADVTDAVLNKDSVNAHEHDSLEVFIDENNGKTDSYQADDKQYRINYANDVSINPESTPKEYVVSATKETETGYVIEAAYKWTSVKPSNNAEIGIEFQINDANSGGTRSGTLSWYDDSGNGWQSTSVYGTAVLVGGPTGGSEGSSSDSGSSSDGGSSSGSTTTPAATPTPSATPEVTVAPEATTAPKAEGTGTPSTAPLEDDTEDVEETGFASMPEEVAEVVEQLETLLDEDATAEEKVEAVQEIVDTVKDMAESGNLESFTRAAIEEVENLIAKALDKALEIEHKGDKVPEVKNVIGALLSVDANKQAKLKVEALGTENTPELEEGFVNGFPLDIKLMADDEEIQPSVPVTIRMEAPEGIDLSKDVKVVHFGKNGTNILDALIFGKEIQFTTDGFSTFVVVNVDDAVAESVTDVTEATGTDVSEAADAEEVDVTAPMEAQTQSGSVTPVIIVVVIVVIIVIAVVAVFVMKSKKEDEE